MTPKDIDLLKGLLNRDSNEIHDYAMQRSREIQLAALVRDIGEIPTSLFCEGPKMNPMPRAFTSVEMRDQFLESIRNAAHYWATLETPERSILDRCNGLAFSILNIIDGTDCGFPASIDLKLSVHESDEQYCKDGGENWVENGQIINDCAVLLHELYYTDEMRGRKR